MKKFIICLIAAAMLLTVFSAALPMQSFSGVYADEEMHVFHDGLAAVCSGGKWGYVDLTGKIVIDYQYNAAFPFSEDKAFIMKEDGVYACIDKTGTELFTVECTAVYPFSEGVARLVRNGLSGFISAEGNPVGEVKWTAAHDAQGGFIAVKDDSGWGYIKTDGTTSVSCKYDTAEDYVKGLAYVTLGEDGYIMDAEGNPYLYGAASGIAENLIKMKTEEGYGFMDKAGKAVIDPVYEDLGMPASSRIPVLSEELWGYMDYTGTMIIQPQWAYAWPFVEGIARVYTSEGGYGFIDTMGNMITTETYADARDFSGGRAAISIEGQWGYIDRIGTVNVECSYEYAANYSENGTAVKSNGAYYILNDKGEKIVFGVEDIPQEVTEEEETEPVAEEKEGLKLTQKIALIITGILFAYDAGLAAIRIINIRRRRMWEY